MSERTACLVVGQYRSTQRHVPQSETVGDPDADLRQWVRDYAKKHPRWGWKRDNHESRAESWGVNHKKI